MFFIALSSCNHLMGGVKAVFYENFILEMELRKKNLKNQERYALITKIELKIQALSLRICKKIIFEKFGVKAVLFWQGDIYKILMKYGHYVHQLIIYLNILWNMVIMCTD